MKKTHFKQNGFTLVELLTTIVICSIVVLAAGVMLVDSHRGWLDSYAKVHGGAANDAKMVQTAFERIIRKSSRSKYLFDGQDDLTVYYYKHWLNSTELDRYARFYRSSDNPSEMYLVHGVINDDDDDDGVLSRVRLASHVTDLEFLPTSGGVEIKLALDDGREVTTVMTTAILHNE
ncbi:MAG: PulJ/GspJ family protein [Planctomycetota bacterium]|jgi:prepilin-type N-terminal cleavage/methylation domain-containing protein